MKEPKKVRTIQWDKWLFAFLKIGKYHQPQYMNEHRDKGQLLTKWNVKLNNGMLWKFALSDYDHNYVGMWYACSGTIYVSELPKEAFISFYNLVAHDKPLPSTQEELDTQRILPTPEDAIYTDR
jgi:hypothetical protein